MKVLWILCIHLLLLLSSCLGKKQKASSEIVGKSAKPEFCYTSPQCGPKSGAWDHYCHGGSRQSPVNIEVSDANAETLKNLRLHRKALQASTFNIRNNGHTIVVTLPTSTRVLGRSHSISNSLRHKFHLDSIQFHWGTAATNGSEHQLQGKTFAMEMHFIHYSTRFESVDAAVRSGDPHALSIIALFVESSSRQTENTLIQIVQSVKKVIEPSPEARHIDIGIDLSTLFPRGAKAYHYHGSLTTPGCNEQVDWYIVDTPIQISATDIKVFRTVIDSRGETLRENHRPLQKLNHRNIEIMGITFG